MAEMRGVAQRMNLQQWEKDNKARALELCSTALDQANVLFDNGDLRPFLTTLTRFHWYNFYNLLLILRQYPNATVLRTFKEWQSLMNDPQAQVLKSDHKGKGIEIVAPFTNHQPQGTRSLSWYSVKQFDISQTNVQNFESTPNIYLSGPDHLFTLNAAIIAAIYSEYGMSTYPCHSDLPPHTGNFGYTEGDIVFWRSDLSDTNKLLWLSECLIALSKPETVIGERFQRAFIRMAQHCLLQIWQIDDPHLLFLPKDHELICSVPSELRPVFLDLLQRRVRHFEETVYSRYQENLKKDGSRSMPSVEAVIRENNETCRKEGNVP